MDTKTLNHHSMTVVATILVVLGLLEVVFGLAAKYCACYGTQNAVAAHLVATEVSGSAATESSHKPSVTLLLHSWVAGTVLLLSGLAIGILALGILILTIGSLLRELVLRLLTGVASLLVLAVLPGNIVRSKMFRNNGLACTNPCCWL